jgi:hypothetical protein
MKLKMVRGLESNMPVNIGRAVPGDSIFNKISPQPLSLKRRAISIYINYILPFSLRRRGWGMR